MLSIFCPLASVSLFSIFLIVSAVLLSNVLCDQSPLRDDNGERRGVPKDGESGHFVEETAPKKSFRGHKLLRLNPRTADQLHWLRQLYSSDLSSSPPFFDLDFWQPPTSQNGALVDLTVSESDSFAFFDELKRRNFEYWLITDDLEELIEKETQRTREKEEEKKGPFWDGHFLGESRRAKEDGQYRYDRYNPLTRIEEQLIRLRETNPRIVTLFDIGRTHENRSIVVVKVSAREHFPDERFRPYKGPAVWVDAGIHAREWIAPATAMLLLARLIDGYNARDANIRYLVESIDWYIAPVLNPDGYEYSHTKNRMWRKNRRPAFCKQQYFNRICCSGVDLNRNFDWFWSTTGSSIDPCHETYHGPSAFSEPEARSVRDFLEDHWVKAFFTLHSYSQLWLIPYGHKRRNYPEDYTKIQRPLSLRAVQALKRLYGTEYQVGSGADLLYEASGASHDFAKGSLNIPYSFLVELRPQNTLHSTGFLLPEAEIMDTAEETWEAVKVVADEILQRFGQFGEERKAWNVSTTTMPAQTGRNSSTTEAATTETTTKRTTMRRATTEMAKVSNERRTTVSRKGNAKERETRKQSMAHKHTFKPNTTSRTTAAVPEAKTNSTEGSPSSVRNAKSGTKMGKQRPTTSVGSSSSAISSAENGSEQKTIVNVKICTGGRSGIIPPFPSPSPSTTEESAEDGEETQTLMEILMPKTPRRLIKCRDWSAYCKWWRMHSLCSDPRVTKMCTLSCLIECQI